MKIIITGALVRCGLWMLYLSRNLIRLGLLSYRWAMTQGTIVDYHPVSIIVPGIDRPRTGFVAPMEYKETDHVYEYVVDGRTYHSNIYCFGGWVDRAGAAFRRGAKVPVYYDPKHPEWAVLKRGLRFGAVFGLIPISMGISWAFLVSR